MPRTRDRLEMIRLSDAGWSIPKISRYLQVDEQRVRFWIKAYLAGGFDALPDKAHLGKKSQLSPEMIEALRQEIAKGERSWTGGQLCEWVAQQYGVRLSAIHLCRLLKRPRLSYKRTTRTLDHKQKPQEVARKEADLLTLKKGHRQV